MKKPNEGFVKVDGGKIWYKVFEAEGDHIPLIVLHGGPGSSSYSLEASLSPLSINRTVVFYDQLGCGKSDRPKNKKLWNKERFVSELEDLRKHLGFETISLLGHSWGSMLAVLYTLKYPKRVKKMVLSGPHLSTQRWINDASKLKKLLPKVIQDKINKHEANGTTNSKEYKEATREYYNNFFCRIDPYPQSLKKSQKGVGLDVYNTMWGPSEFYCTGNLKTADLTSKLARINIPVLLICGKYDMATPNTTRYYQSKFPNAEMKVLNNSSHTMFIEQPKEYLNLIDKFLK